MKKQCPFCSEEILIEAIKCKHCREFLENKTESKRDVESSSEKNNRSLITTIIVIVVIIFLYIFYTKLRANAEHQRRIYDSYEYKSDNYRLPSGKVIDLARVPSDSKYEVKTYLSYKDKRDSWSAKGYGDEAQDKVDTFNRIIESYETEHPQVREMSYSVRTVRNK
jgi:uncharacterized membrane protein YvbJ